MRKSLVFVLIMILLCCGCSKNEDKRQINILNWSSYIPNEVILSFEKETGIDVNYGTYSSNEELLAKVSVAKKGTYDLVFPSDYMVEVMINRDLIQEMDTSKLSNVGNLNLSFLNKEYDLGNKYTLPFLAASTKPARFVFILSASTNFNKEFLCCKFNLRFAYLSIIFSCILTL